MLRDTTKALDGASAVPGDPSALARACLAVAISRDVEGIQVVAIGDRAYFTLERDGREEPFGVVPRSLGEATIVCLGALAGGSLERVRHVGQVTVAMNGGRGRVLVQLDSGPDGPAAELRRVGAGVEPWVPRPSHASIPARLGAYELEEELGRGGGGVVYRAVHRALEREAAIKILNSSRGHHAEATVRFLREARAASRIDHEGIVRVYDFGTARDGRPYMVMERVRGRTLRQVLEVAGALDSERVRRIGRRIAVALDAAHEAGVVHCDIKPDNIFLVGDDAVKVGDFGAALLAEATESGFSVVGTPAYIAPERFLDGDASVSSDLYALGCTLFELLTDRLPFEEDELLELIAAHQHAPPPALGSSGRSVPPALGEVVARCMAKRPEERPPSAAWVAERLAASS